MRSAHYDVCIIGGGPAGSAAAIRLNECGFRVILVERERFPRRKIGESLTPSILPLLDRLNVRDQIEEANFLRPHSAIVRWATDATSTVRENEHGDPGFQVDRAVFDNILLVRAKEGGTHILSPALAVEVRQSGEKCFLRALTPSGSIEIVCSYVIDGGGRQGFVKSGRRRRSMPATVALFAYWKGHGLQGPQSRVEAGSECWYWAAPLADGSANLAAFIDPGTIAISRQSLDRAYWELLSKSALLKGCLAGVRTTPVRACNASSEQRVDPIGEYFICCGEAALCVDPLSAQGTLLSMIMGVQGAAVTNTILSNPSKRQVAEDFYRDQVNDWARHYGIISAGFYSEMARVDPTKFWITRSTAQFEAKLSADALDPDARLVLSPDVRQTSVGVLMSDQVGMVPALQHPNLRRSIAYVREVPVVAVLEKISKPGRAYEIAARLVPLMGHAAAIAVVQEMWVIGVLQQRIDPQ